MRRRHRADAPLRVVFLELGPQSGGIARWFRIVVGALGARPGIEARTTRAALHRGLAPRSLLRVVRDLRRADLAVVPSSPNGLFASRMAGLVQRLALAVAVPRIALDCHDVYGSGMSRMERLGVWSISRRSKVAIVHAQADVAHFERSYPGGRVATIPHFIERRPMMGRLRARAAYGLEEDTIITSVVGWIHARKNYELALDVLGELGGHAQLWLLGDATDENAPYLQQIKEIARARSISSQVLVTGYLDEDELTRRLAATDVGLCPYTSASASGSFATLLSGRTPVVSTDIPSAREYAAQADNVVALVPGDAGGAAFARHVERFVDNPPAASAFDDILASRDIGAIAEAYEGTLRAAHPKRRRSRR